MRTHPDHSCCAPCVPPSFEPSAGLLSSSTMLSTTQALKEWDKVLKLLADLKANAAAHPNQGSTPQALAQRLKHCREALNTEWASPVATWRELVQKQVRTRAVPMSLWSHGYCHGTCLGVLNQRCPFCCMSAAMSRIFGLNRIVDPLCYWLWHVS